MRVRQRSLLALLAPWLLAGTADPGIVLEIDLARFRLETRDLLSPDPGPSLRIAVGSPSHPTPTGEFRPQRVVRNPGWTPGPLARALGAQPLPPSSDGPLGAGKIPLEAGAIQIHGGAHPLELGKPVSLGCVRLADPSWLALLEWLEERATLHPWHASPDGAAVSDFRRPIRVIVR